MTGYWYTLTKKQSWKFLGCWNFFYIEQKLKNWIKDLKLSKCRLLQIFVYEANWIFVRHCQEAFKTSQIVFGYICWRQILFLDVLRAAFFAMSLERILFNNFFTVSSFVVWHCHIIITSCGCPCYVCIGSVTHFFHRKKALAWLQ